MPRRKKATVSSVPDSETSCRSRGRTTTPVTTNKGQKTPTENKSSRLRPFPERLEWKRSYLTMPTTSTPIAKKKTNSREIFTKKDVETAFGFDESANSEVEANYSTLISPIARTSPTTLKSSLGKTNPLTQRNAEIKLEPPEPDLQIDPKQIRRTYGSRKRIKVSEEDREPETEYNFVPFFSDVPLPSTTRADKGDTKAIKPKLKRIRKTTKKQDVDELDDEAKRWLEEKNKEFEDVLKVPLVIESSFSD